MPAAASLPRKPGTGSGSPASWRGCSAASRREEPHSLHRLKGDFREHAIKLTNLAPRRSSILCWESTGEGGLMLSWFRVLASRLRGSLHRSTVQRELREELRTHAEMLTDENIRSGMSAEEARRQAAIRLGNAARIGEDYRQQ